MAQTLFEKYGGIKTIAAVVTLFYDKVQDTPQLDKYFENTDMKALINHQTNFLGKALGGPANQYTGRTLKEAHGPLNVSKEDFLKVVELLEAALVESKVERKDIDTILGVVASTRPDIVA